MNINDLYRIYQDHPMVTTDTRRCPADSLFFALRGANFNGNAFALQALAGGCAYAVVDDADVQGDPRLIHVDDVLRTLQQLAAFHRRRLGLPVVQITGTNGKTTTKELTAAILARRYNVLYTEGNLNNHIGVPLTLLRIEERHDVAVVETGANHPGEIAELSSIVEPDCGLITNVGKAHLEGFGSFEGVVRTKGELYAHLRKRPDTLAIVNGDDDNLVPMAEGLRQTTYGRPGNGYDVEGEAVACTPFVLLRWRVRGTAWRETPTRLIGAYNADNLLAAIAVGAHFGVSGDDMEQAIAAYVPTNSRSELKRTDRNELIIDAYNANPTSMRAALDNFRQIDHPHKMAILGEMRELGAAADEEHAAVVRQAAECGCEELWLVGEAFAPHAAGCRYFPDIAAVRQALTEQPVAGRMILIKGSNGTRVFQLPDLL